MLHSQIQQHRHVWAFISYDNWLALAYYKFAYYK